MEHISIAYMGIYLDELDEQLQLLDRTLLELETADSGNLQPILQAIFRAAHTLKGSSAAMGFDRIKQLTHSVESVFDLLRAKRVPPDTALTNTLFGCIDYLKVQRESFLRGEFAELPIEQLVAQLEHCMNTAACMNESGDAMPGVHTVKDGKPPESSSGGSAANIAAAAAGASHEPDPHAAAQQKNAPESGSPGGASAVISAPSRAESADEGSLDLFEPGRVAAARTALKPGEQLCVIRFTMKRDTEMAAARALLFLEDWKPHGELWCTFPSAFELASTEWNPPVMQALFSTGKDAERLLDDLHKRHIDLENVSIERLGGKSAPEGPTPQPTAAAVSSVQPPAQETKGRIAQTVRVDVGRLEHLINLVGELVIDQTRLHEVGRRLSASRKGEGELGTLEDITNHLSRVIGELQEGMMKTRMLPIEQLFNRFPRLIRDLSHKAGKEIELTIEGKETELDRTLIEEISDPLIHMLRNAADHGLEPPDERERQGKPRKGRIVLKAEHQENAIILTVADDGRGIDPERNKRKAIQKGFLTEQEADRLSNKQLISLIFRSGMSTAEQVTELSGRGVGMDIVRAQIEKLNGMIDIDTTLGQGTIFTIKLPLTLAIIRSLLVEVEERTYALPLMNVLEIFRLQPSDVKMLQGQEVCMVRGEIVPLVSASRIMQFGGGRRDKKRSGDKLFAVMIGMAEKRICLVVDRPIGNQEIVIKPLGSFVGQVPFIAGSTIMGDGNVALILDVGAIIRSAGQMRSSDEGGNTGIPHARETKLVAFEVESESYAFPIRQVKEIITPPPMSMMVGSDSRMAGIIHLRGAIVPVYEMRHCLGMDGSSSETDCRVLIVDAGGRDAGFKVDKVSQVVSAREDAIEQAPERADGHSAGFIRGVYNMDGQLITIVDAAGLLACGGIRETAVAGTVQSGVGR